MTVLNNYLWGQLGDLRPTPQLPWGTALSRNIKVTRIAIESLGGTRSFDTIGPAALAEWELTWPLLTERQLGMILEAYRSSVPFYFVDASSNNHMPVSSVLIAQNGARAIEHTTTRGPHGGFAPAYLLNPGEFLRPSGRVPCMGNMRVSGGVSAMALSSTTPATTADVFLDWFDASGAQLGNSTAALSLFPGVWSDPSFNAVAPNFTASVKMAVRFSGGPGFLSQFAVRLRDHVPEDFDPRIGIPGGSAKVAILTPPDVAVISPLMRTASLTLSEVL